MPPSTKNNMTELAIKAESNLDVAVAHVVLVSL